MNYKNLKEITVKTQKELDMIPKDFKGHIYIEFGTEFVPAIVNNKYYYRVIARGNSSVVAWGNSSVVAWGNSSVEARGNSSVVAWGNSSVEAWDNSSVEARGNVQVCDCLCGGKIKISGNARIVHNPKNIHDFMDFYGIKHTKTKAIFYKAVRKSPDGVYYSNYDNNFTYNIGEKKEEKSINTNTNENCDKGIHIAHLNWALNYGSNWDNLAILEVETNISDIICPVGTTGKVRTSAIKVIREVPLKECGLYVKILAKRKSQKEACK